MKKSGMGTLMLAAAITACAPAVVGPGGQPVTVTGQAYAAAVRVPVAELTLDTPESSYVTFPECGAAVSVVYVRQQGPEEGARACKAAGSDTGRNVLRAIGVGVGVGLVAFVTFIWAIVSALGTG